MKSITAWMLFILAAAASADTTVKWVAETAKPAELNETIGQGETVILAPMFKDYGVPRSFGTSDWAALYYQTNGMGTAWYTGNVATISLTETGRVSATWSPDLDIGAMKYRFFIGVVQSNQITYRAFGSLAMRRTPGFLPALRNPAVATWATYAFASNALAVAEAAEAMANDASGRVTTVEGWGDHRLAGYATGLVVRVESDPVALPIAQAGAAAASAVSGRVTTVEGWGDHRLAGYATGPVVHVESDPVALPVATNAKAIAENMTWDATLRNSAFSAWYWHLGTGAEPGAANNMEVIAAGNGLAWRGYYDALYEATLTLEVLPGQTKRFLNLQGLPLGINMSTGTASQVLYGGGRGYAALPDYLLATGDGSQLTGITPEQIGAARTNAAYVWQGSLVITGAADVALSGLASNNADGGIQLFPYSSSFAGGTGTVVFTATNGYLVDVDYDAYVSRFTVADGVPPPGTAVALQEIRLSPTQIQVRAYSVQSGSILYYASLSNVVFRYYDRPGLTAGGLTNDAAGVVARVDAPATNDQRGVMNRAAVADAITARKNEIADHAWRRTPGGKDAPDPRVVTLDQPLVQQGPITWLQSGDYYLASYDGGDWRNVATGSVWQIGPSGRVAFEITSTNRMLHIQAFTVENGYSTIDISTNDVVGVPSIEFTADLANPQWLSCPAQTMTNMTTYWRGVCPATATSRFFRAVSPGGESTIVSHYRHVFQDGMTLGGTTFTNLTQLKALLEALP